MSIADEISRINSNIASAYTGLAAKGAVIPQVRDSANLRAAVDSIDTQYEIAPVVYFYDYDGTLLHRYSEVQINALSELPPMPVHEGLTATEWNWTLEDIRSYITAYRCSINVGCYFKTSDDKTKIHIRLTDSNVFQFTLIQSYPNAAVIDWGDGSAPERLSTASSSDARPRYEASHTYSPASYPAEYVISIDIDSSQGDWYGFGGGNNLYGITNYNGGTPCGALIKRIHLANNASIQGWAFYKAEGAEIITMTKRQAESITGECGFYGCRHLKFTIVPRNVGNYQYYGCSRLENVSFSKNITSIEQYAFNQCCGLLNVFGIPLCGTIKNSAFYDCWKLKRVDVLPTCISIGKDAFRSCYQLETIGPAPLCATIGQYAFYYCYSLRTTPALVSLASNAFYQALSLEKIVFPAGASSIGTNNFYGDILLSEVDLTAFTDPTHLPTLNGVFSSVFPTQNEYSCGFTIYVANAEMKAAFSSATNWSNGANYYAVREATA